MAEDECPWFMFHSFHLKCWHAAYSSKFIPQPTVEGKFFSKSYIEWWENGNIVGITLMQ
jgi:hypothetical protein